MNNMEEVPPEFNATLYGKTKLSPKRRFRAIVRMVIANLLWLQDSQVQFGENVYKKRNVMNLEVEIKTLLNKLPEDRTEEDNEKIYERIGNFKFYRKYSEDIRKLLANYTQFVCYGADRTIVRTEHYATAIFYILNGEANIVEEKFDEYLKKTKTVVREILCPGDVFGELCLLHNLPRMETIISTTPIEFLILRREYFDLVLRDILKEEWDLISQAMDIFDYFKDWDTLRVAECCMQSILNVYKKGEIIIGDGFGRPEYIHFVIKGKCVMIEHLYVQKLCNSVTGQKSFLKHSTLSNGSMTRQLGSKSHTSGDLEKIQQYVSSWFQGMSKQSTIRKSLHNIFSDDEEEEHVEEEQRPSKDKELPNIVFMQVCTFYEKACFSIGECMDNRRIVAEEECTCLLVPAFLLLGRDCAWLRIKQFITRQIPDTNAVFREYLNQSKWRQYRGNLVAPLQSKQTCNWHANIPYTIRVRSDFNYKPNKNDPFGRQELHERIKASKL